MFAKVLASNTIRMVITTLANGRENEEKAGKKTF